MNIKSRDYFPPKSNSIYIYKSLGNNFFNFKRYIEYSTINKVQMRFDNDISDIINIYEYTDDGVKLSFYKKDIHYNQCFLDIENNTNSYLIKDPIVKYNSWSLPDGGVRCITDIDIEVKTKYNLFNSVIEIVTLSKNNEEFSIDYYALGIGLVKSICYTSKIGLLCCELDDVLNDLPYSKPINIYYPDRNLNAIWKCNRTSNLFTNENITLIFSNEFENPPKGLLSLITRNTLINNMYYNIEKKSVTIDFSIDILDYIKTNFIKYDLFFDCIYHTLKDYYNTTNICITINDISYDYYFNKIDINYKVPIQQWKIEECRYPFTYLVKADDTLINLSKKFNIHYDRLAKLNNIKNPNKLSKNQVLQICSSGIYTIKENDSLESIADMFGLSTGKLLSLNNISSSTMIIPGQKIKLC